MVPDIAKKPDRSDSTTNPNDAVALRLTRLLASCPFCRSHFSGHSFALLATCLIGKKKDGAVVGYLEAVTSHDWTKLRTFQSWEGNADNVEGYAIRCSQRIVLVVVKSHFELFLGHHLLYTEGLSAEESANLSEVFKDLNWQPFRK